jgi:hypothetical protein
VNDSYIFHITARLTTPGATARLAGSKDTAPSFSAVLDEIYSPADKINSKTDELTKEAISA